MKKETLDDELQELSPFLRDLKRQKNGLRLPEDYFTGLEASVFSKIDSLDARRPALMEPAHGKSFRSRFLQSNLMLALAAMFTLALAAIWFFRPAPVVSEPLAALEATELTETEIAAYLMENIHEFDADQLAVLPLDEETSERPQLPEVNQQPSPLPDDVLPEEMKNLLQDMSDEELEELL